MDWMINYGCETVGPHYDRKKRLITDIFVKAALGIAIYKRHPSHNYNLLFDPVTFNKQRPLLKTTLPLSFFVTKRTSSNPSCTLPILQISVVSLSPGRTGEAKRAWNSFRLVGSLPPSSRRMPCAVEFQLNRPWMMIPPNPSFWPGSGVACRGL